MTAVSARGFAAARGPWIAAEVQRDRAPRSSVEGTTFCDASFGRDDIAKTVQC